VIAVDERLTEHSTDQQTCVILAFLHSTSIFVELANHYYFHYLVNLVNLQKVKDLSWEAPIYSFLICGMRARVQKIEGGALRITSSRVQSPTNDLTLFCWVFYFYFFKVFVNFYCLRNQCLVYL